jgi:hypothetical protein
VVIVKSKSPFFFRTSKTNALQDPKIKEVKLNIHTFVHKLSAVREHFPPLFFTYPFHGTIYNRELKASSVTLFLFYTKNSLNRL